MELTTEGLTKKFRETTAVDDVSYTFGNGVYGLLGVNGAGKTTLMRMLCTLLEPTGGTILFDGQDIFSMGADYRKLLGYLPQEFGFYPDFTVKDYLFYIASIKGLRPVAAKKRVPELLAQVSLTKYQNRKMKKLSGGMKRRAGIAQAMLNDPKILILDEPTAGLDPAERIRFRNLLGELAQDRLVLLSTHIVSDVESIAGQIMLMKDGRIIRFGTSDEIINDAPIRAWLLTVPPKDVRQYEKTYKISNIKSFSGRQELRILSERSPHPDAVPVDLNLEDVFLHYFGEKGGEQDDIL